MAANISGFTVVTLTSLIHSWMPIHTHCLPPVRVSVDGIVTLTSLVHQWMPIHTHCLPQYPRMAYLLWHPWSIPGWPYIHNAYPYPWLTVTSLVHQWMPIHTHYTPCRVPVDGIVTYIPGPSVDAHSYIYTAYPLSEYLWMAYLLWHPWSIPGCPYIHTAYPLPEYLWMVYLLLYSWSFPECPYYVLVLSVLTTWVSQIDNNTLDYI